MPFRVGASIPLLSYGVVQNPSIIHHPGFPAAFEASATSYAIRAPALWLSCCNDRESAACRATSRHAFGSEPCPEWPEPYMEYPCASSHRNGEHVAWGNASFPYPPPYGRSQRR